MGVVFSKFLAYRRSDPMILATVVVLVAAVANYYAYFDVLAPGINQSGSVKENMGALFLAPILLLTAIQLLYSAGILHLVTRSFFFEKRDFLKALFVSACVILLFSGFYTLVPTWGPYTFLTGAYRNVPLLTYGLLAAYTGFLLLATTLLIRQVYGFSRGEVRSPVLLLLASSIFLVVMAFATG